MRSTMITSTLTALLITALMIPANLSSRLSAHAQDVELQDAPGDLDTSFGNGGKVTTDVSGKQSAGKALAIQPDGKLIVAGNVSNAAGDFAVARFNSDGTLDSSFGNGGTVMTDFFGGSDTANAIAVQADGRIVVAGSARSPFSIETADFALARYNPNGSLDTSFGGGKVTTDVSGYADIASALVILPDGRLIVGGLGFRESGEESFNFELARYNANGSLDSSFGNGGKVITDLFGNAEGINALAVQPDGKILAAGFTYLKPNEGMEQFALVRYNTDGGLDQSFGNSGKMATDFSGQQDGANAIALRKDGKIIVAGLTFSSQADFALARYNPDGSLDTAFGADGKVTTDFAGNDDSLQALVLQADDKIIAAGRRKTSDNTDTQDFALARYNANGSLDTSFGAGGKVSTDFSGLLDIAYALILQPDGKVVAAGYSYHSTGPTTSATSMVLARYSVGEIAAPGFSLAFEQSPVTGERGTTAKVHVFINRTGGFTGNVTVTPPDTLPAGIVVKPRAPIFTIDSVVTFKLKIKPGADVGHTALTFTGQDDSGRIATATLTLVIQ